MPICRLPKVFVLMCSSKINYYYDDLTEIMIYSSGIEIDFNKQMETLTEFYYYRKP